MSVLTSSGISGITNYSLKTGCGYYRIKISPVKRSSIILAHILDATVLSFIQAAILIGISLLMSVRIASGISGVFLMIVLLFLTTTFVSALSYTISLTLPDENSFIALVNSFTLPLFFVSSALMPYEQVPSEFRIPVFINPFTHVVDSVRLLILKDSVDWMQFTSTAGLLFVLCIVSFILAVYSLKNENQ